MPRSIGNAIILEPVSPVSEASKYTQTPTLQDRHTILSTLSEQDAAIPNFAVALSLLFFCHTTLPLVHTLFFHVAKTPLTEQTLFILWAMWDCWSALLIIQLQQCLWTSYHASALSRAQSHRLLYAWGMEYYTRWIIQRTYTWNSSVNWGANL